MTLSPSIVRKLRSNDPPTAEEVGTIRKALGGSLDRLHALDTEIIRLQAKSRILSLQQQELSSFIDDHQKLLSPLRRLQPEILQEVFYHCLPTAHNAVMSAKDAPLLLGRVCSQWRQLAYSTPKLWTSIHIFAVPMGSPPRCRGLAREQAISSWLSRSGVLPLSISISTHGRTFRAMRSRNPINPQIQPYIDLIAPYSRRWRALHLTFFCFDWTDFFSTFNASNLPLLERLHIDGNYRRRRDVTLDLSSLRRDNGILSAPRLRVLSIPFFIPHLLELHIRWRSLTGLNLSSRSLSLQDTAKILSLCSTLESCSVSVISPEPYLTPNPPDPPFEITELTSPNLRALWIRCRSSTNVNTHKLLNKLSCPMLQHLAYERTTPKWLAEQHEPDGFRTFHSSLHRFLQRLVNPLQELDLWTVSFTDNDVRDIMSLVPGLLRLSLTGLPQPVYDSDASPLSPSHPPVSDDTLLSYLTPTPAENSSQLVDIATEPGASACLCPRLEVFHCTGVYYSNRGILDFLRSRSINHGNFNVAHLQRASISFGSSRRESENGGSIHEFQSDIRTLAKETGIVVVLDYPPPTSSRTMFPAFRSSPYDGVTSNDTVLRSGGYLDYFGF